MPNEQHKPAMKAWRFIPPEAICVYRTPDIPRGAISCDPSLSITDDRIIMSSVWYTTPFKIHGLFMHEMANQSLFLGYRCHACDKVFLVSDSVKDHGSLNDAMQHECTLPTR